MGDEYRLRYRLPNGHSYVKTKKSLDHVVTDRDAVLAEQEQGILSPLMNRAELIIETRTVTKWKTLTEGEALGAGRTPTPALEGSIPSSPAVPEVGSDPTINTQEVLA